VARTAALLGLKSGVFVPSTVEQWSVDAISSEGCSVTMVDGDYDEAVKAAADAADAGGKDGVLVQDMSWDGYLEAPQVCFTHYLG
jgi:diaminopropionate ammonia-lyase